MPRVSLLLAPGFSSDVLFRGTSGKQWYLFRERTEREGIGKYERTQDAPLKVSRNFKRPGYARRLGDETGWFGLDVGRRGYLQDASAASETVNFSAEGRTVESGQRPTSFVRLRRRPTTLRSTWRFGQSGSRAALTVSVALPAEVSAFTSHCRVGVTCHHP